VRGVPEHRGLTAERGGKKRDEEAASAPRAIDLTPPRWQTREAIHVSQKRKEESVSGLLSKNVWAAEDHWAVIFAPVVLAIRGTAEGGWEFVYNSRWWRGFYNMVAHGGNPACASAIPA